MITAAIQNEADRVIAAIEADHSSSQDEKRARIERVQRSLASCNGHTIDERVEGIAKSLFDLTCAFEMWTNDFKSRYLERPTTWKDVIIQCRKSIVMTVAFVSILLIFRPEVAEAISQIWKHAQ